MKTNDILVSHWGYEQTNVEFYKVIQATKNTLVVQELEIIEFNDEDMAGWVMPIDKLKGQPFRRKIHINNGEEFIRINNYSKARKWNHQKQRYTNYNEKRS